MTRFTIDIDEKFNQTLERLANGGSKADVIRRAVQTYSYLKSEIDDAESSKNVSISDPSGNIQKVIILP